MKLHSDAASGKNRITAYGADYVCVNGQRITHSLVVTPETLHLDWPPMSWADLSGGHLWSLLDLGAEIVLLGSGPLQQTPSSALLETLAQMKVGVEIMTTAAACRTYNILVAEGRMVAAALIVASDRSL
ncbi:MAG: Mth938-like domain-containing protein [Gammaproteobacteria bacterium]